MRKDAAAITLDSVLTCPCCGDQARETMPTDACLFFYDCTACGARLKPREGDCCVFCSFGSVPFHAITQQESPNSLSSSVHCALLASVPASSCSTRAC